MMQVRFDPTQPSLAQPKEGRIQKQTERTELWTTSFSTRCTQQTSPYSLTKLQKLLNPFLCSFTATVNSLIRWDDRISEQL